MIMDQNKSHLTPTISDEAILVFYRLNSVGQWLVWILSFSFMLCFRFMIPCIKNCLHNHMPATSTCNASNTLWSTRYWALILFLMKIQVPKGPLYVNLANKAHILFKTHLLVGIGQMFHQFSCNIAGVRALSCAVSL